MKERYDRNTEESVAFLPSASTGLFTEGSTALGRAMFGYRMKNDVTYSIPRRSKKPKVVHFNHLTPYTGKNDTELFDMQPV